MALAVGQDETPDPAHIRLLRTQAVVLHPQPLPHLVEQLRRLNIPRYILAIIPVTHTPAPWADNHTRLPHPRTRFHQSNYCMCVGFFRSATTPPRGHTRRNASFHRASSEEHTSALQSLMRITYAVFCLKKK